MSACEQVRMLLALRPEDWGEDERRQVESHLAACAACQIDDVTVFAHGSLLLTSTHVVCVV